MDVALNHQQDDFDSFILKYTSNSKYRRELHKFAKTVFHSIEKYTKYLESKKNFCSSLTKLYISDLNIEKYLAKFRIVYLSEKFLPHYNKSNRSEYNFVARDINILAINTLLLFLKP